MSIATTSLVPSMRASKVMQPLRQPVFSWAALMRSSKLGKFSGLPASISRLNSKTEPLSKTFCTYHSGSMGKW